VPRKAIGSESFEITGADLLERLNSFPPAIKARARVALGDFHGKHHCAFDTEGRRAFCFQRQGFRFVYQNWDEVPDHAAADRLFAGFPGAPLPYSAVLAEQMYIAALK
jgi:hypothetical protein